MNKWETSDNYFGPDFSEYFICCRHSAVSDCREESNFATALERLGGKSETVLIIRQNHWACGWIEWIGIHESDEKAIAIGNQIEVELQDYPVLDEDDLARREQEAGLRE